ncbi:MAG: hypothetical protein NTX25_02375 [Proteobacteria bacterium]|nr:hypothetical protein [Pseudomonadota bacterium]
MKSARTYDAYFIIMACWVWVGSLGLLCPSLLAQTQLEWQSSQALLKEAAIKPEGPGASPWLESSCRIITQSLRNPEQHQQLASLRASRKDLTPAADPIFLAAYGSKSKSEASSSYEIEKTMQNFLEKEAKSSAMPESLKKGLSFDFGTDHKEGPSPAIRKDPIRYGLILTSIEPSPTPFRLASISQYDEYSLIPYAPKADLHYRIGAIQSDSEEPQRAQWGGSQPDTDKLSKWKDLHFKAKLVPRGQMSAKQIAPPQSLSIDESRGYYSLEIQTSQIIHRDAILHRILIPLKDDLRLRQERDIHFHANRNTLENVYSRGALALNLDQFVVEKRYQSSLIYRKNLTSFELDTHLPNQSSKSQSLWQQQRWELKLERAF